MNLPTNQAEMIEFRKRLIDARRRNPEALQTFADEVIAAADKLIAEYQENE
jgi:hypothetical protein